jgi:hypothetical protein
MVIAAFVTGVLFLIALLAIACFLTFRVATQPVPVEAMFLFRVILALAGGGFATALSGFLEISGTLLSWTVRASGSLAVLVALYSINPPDLIRTRIPRPAKPRRVAVPEERLEPRKEP